MLLTLCLISMLISKCGSLRTRSRTMKCERITIPLCQKIEYNLTYVPNMFGHPTQTDAALHAHQFWPLVRINCSPDLKLFICATHAPVCEENYGKPLLPCRSFCERVRDACTPIIKTHDMSWPEYLDCNKFPKNTQRTVCMEKDFGGKKTKSPRRNTKKSREKSKELLRPKPTHGKSGIMTKLESITRSILYKKTTEGPHRLSRNRHFQNGETCGCMCQKPFVYVNRSIEDGPIDVPSCALQCKSYFFNPSQQNLSTFWITLWSFLCLIATFITCMTALIDAQRFKYPERPVVCIAFCYLMLSSGYVVRLARGFETVACNSKTNILRYSATGPADCTAVFLLVYFFGMAACLWWVILALNWFLSAGIKWSNETIASYSQYFHFVAWLVPTVKSMAVLAMAAVDSDPVSGLCYVGNHDNTMLTIFVISPILVYLTIGSSFLIAGLFALYNNRRICKRQGYTTCPKIDKILIKIGVFAVICIIPISVTVLCHFYEHGNRESWEKSRNCPCVRDKNEPKFYVFLVKYFMSLVTGVATGFWLWGTRTIDSWRRFFNNIFESRKEQTPKAVAV